MCFGSGKFSLGQGNQKIFVTPCWAPLVSSSEPVGQEGQFGINLSGIPQHTGSELCCGAVSCN